MNNTNRIIKAAKRTLRAEVNLIIVIIIITSWSIYALYKLALSSGPDSSSLFGLSLNIKPNNRDVTIKNDTNQPDFDLPPQQQLAIYKSQILKELLDRQRELFGDLKQHPPNKPPEPGLPLVSDGKLNLDQLQQWQGGYKLPSTLDNLLISKQYRDHKASPNNQLTLISADSRELPRDNFKILHNAPSLMQLREPLVTTTPRPTTNGLDGERNIVDYDREPEESSIDSREYESPTEDARESTNEDNHTTESTSPETTTATPTTTTTTSSTTTTEEPPLSEQIIEQQETTTAVPTDQRSQKDPYANISDNNNNGSDNNSDEQEPDDESMRRARKTAMSIDEEVDRMTQPSSGMISRHREPQNHEFRQQLKRASTVDYKNTVQFDDAPVNLTLPVFKTNRNQETIASRKLNKPNTVNVDDLATDNNRPRKKLSVSSHSEPSDILPALNNLILNPRKRSKRSTPTTGDARNSIESPEELAKMLMKRLDADDVDDSDHDGNDKNNQHKDRPSNNQPKLESRIPAASGKNYQYITSNDPSLQELLAHKQLLDALKQSRLPPPVGIPSIISHNVGNGSLVPARSTLDPDHHSADTENYTMDEGLLLYPSADEEHHYKKMSKKSSHSAKKDEKKKEHVAMKKGGHKKKKHKKEEKKYHKEKKFKGAKKGKKMKKGKGGKGGKKGSKFYKDKGFKKKGFKNIYVKNEFGQKKSYFDEFRDKDFKKKWKNFDDKYNYAQMKKWQAKEMKGAKKVKDHGENMKKYDKSKWKKKYMALKKSEASKKKKKKMDEFR